MSDSFELPVEHSEHDTLLIREKRFLFARFHCDPDDMDFARPTLLTVPYVVVPRKPIIMNHAAGLQQICYPASAIIYESGTRYDRVALGSEGDDCLYFGLDRLPTAVRRMVRKLRPGQPVPLTLGQYAQINRAAQTSSIRENPNDLQMILSGLISEWGQKSEQISATPGTWGLVNRAQKIVTSDPSARFALSEIAARVQCSPTHLTRAFQAIVGLSVHQFLLHVRLSIALRQISANTEDLTSVGLGLGFYSQSHFGSFFKRAFGISPSGWRDRCRYAEAEANRH